MILLNAYISIVKLFGNEGKCRNAVFSKETTFVLTCFFWISPNLPRYQSCSDDHDSHNNVM